MSAAEYSKERYYWLKEHHVCVKCGQADAERNSIYCLTCREDNRLSSRNRYHQKAKSKQYRKKEALRKRKAYYELKSNGRCTRCGKLLTEKSTTLCRECYSKAKRKYKPIDGYDRSERPNYGRCFICGKHELYSDKLCEKCFKRASANIKKINENPTPAMLEARKNISHSFRIFFQSKKNKIKII